MTEGRLAPLADEPVRPGCVAVLELAGTLLNLQPHVHLIVTSGAFATPGASEGPQANAARPDVILLDLNLPRMDGREVLRAIKSDERLRRIPVVLTTSSADEDVIRSYDLQANCYITKPIDLDQFMRVVRTIGELWLEIVRLPPDQG